MKYNTGIQIFKVVTALIILLNVFSINNEVLYLLGRKSIVSKEIIITNLSNYHLEFLYPYFQNDWVVYSFSFSLMLCCIFLILNIGKQVTGILLFLFLLILECINPFIFNGSGAVIASTLFFLIFAINYSKENPKFIHKLFFTGLKLQVCFIYLFAGVSKLYSELWLNGEAFFYIMRNEQFNAFVYNDWISSFPIIVMILTYSFLLWELTFAFLIWHKKLKWIPIVLGIQFHLGSFIFTRIEDFPWIMIASYAFFITDKEFIQIYDLIKKRVSFDISILNIFQMKEVFNKK